VSQTTRVQLPPVTPMDTLVLDLGYAPIKVVPWQRAVQLLFLNKVEVIEEYDKDVHSTYLVIKMPAVVRLLHKFRMRPKSVKFSRVNIYGRDNYSCQYCGAQTPLIELTYDHVVPRAQGGKTTWTNIVTACETCNTRKGGRTPAQAKMRLLREPKQPRDIPAALIGFSRRSVPEAWRDYLYWTGELEQG
jgi:5-methylcytosine-specific restriction endonuclease McrA